jgi:hypothetical protein
MCGFEFSGERRFLAANYGRMSCGLDFEEFGHCYYKFVEETHSLRTGGLG